MTFFPTIRSLHVSITFWYVSHGIFLSMIFITVICDGWPWMLLLQVTEGSRWCLTFFFLSSIFTLRYVHLGIRHGTLYRLQFTVSLTFCALGNQKVMWPALLGYLLYCDVCLIVIFALLRWSETEPATSNIPEGCLYSAPPFGTATCHVPNRHKWLASTRESEAERGPTLGATSWFSHLLSLWPFWFPVFIWKITL